MFETISEFLKQIRITSDTFAVALLSAASFLILVSLFGGNRISIKDIAIGKVGKAARFVAGLLGLLLFFLSINNWLPWPTDPSWVPISGSPKLHQISFGDPATAWGLDSDQRIYKWNKASMKWTPIQHKKSHLKNISVGADGTVWGVNKENKVYRRFRKDTKFKEIQKVRLRQISVGNKDNVVGVGLDSIVVRWHQNSKQFKVLDDSVKIKFVSVGYDGEIWAVDASGLVLRRGRKDDEWTKIKNISLKQVSVGKKGHVWGVNSDDKVFRWDERNSAFKEGPNSPTWVSVDFKGRVWGVMPNGEIVKFKKQEVELKRGSQVAGKDNL